jgi:hypothetical protein
VGTVEEGLKAQAEAEMILQAEALDAVYNAMLRNQTTNPLRRTRTMKYKDLLEEAREKRTRKTRAAAVSSIIRWLEHVEAVKANKKEAVNEVTKVERDFADYLEKEVIDND